MFWRTSQTLKRLYKMLCQRNYKRMNDKTLKLKGGMYEHN